MKFKHVKIQETWVLKLPAKVVWVSPSFSELFSNNESSVQPIKSTHVS